MNELNSFNVYRMINVQVYDYIEKIKKRNLFAVTTRPAKSRP
jgi:hypothetical protein